MISERENPAPWGGRFSQAMAEEFVRFSSSVAVEGRLLASDIAASRAHVAMLESVGLISGEDRAQIEAALISIEREFAEGTIALSDHLEDIHMNLESLVIERCGEAGRKLHTARSRNDQQAVAQRLYFKHATAALGEDIRALQWTILEHCKRYRDLVMPSYTHLQRAEVTRYAHWLSTYVVMLQRDRERLLDALRRADESPLGACASTGTSLGIDRRETAEALGFAAPTLHSIDSVSDRDYLLDFGAAGATLMIHLSRLSEELITFASAEFGFVDLDEAYCTGSSIMPQKKNPDALELVRGKAATAIGNMVALFTLMKSLPLGYNKDLQQDKTSWFPLLDDCCTSVRMIAGVVGTMRPNADAMRAATTRGHIAAVEYANHLVRCGVPFRQAHVVVGRLVKLADERGVDVTDLDPETLHAASPFFAADVLALFPGDTERRKNSSGSCGDEALPALLDRLEQLVQCDRAPRS